MIETRDLMKGLQGKGGFQETRVKVLRLSDTSLYGDSPSTAKTTEGQGSAF